jgi:hypothetical protein
MLPLGANYRDGYLGGVAVREEASLRALGRARHRRGELVDN